MTNTPDIDRLAQAAQGSMFRADCCLHKEICQIPPCVCMEATVRAVLHELRKPSEGMVKAANTAYEHDYEYGIADDDMGRALTAAVAHLLGEDGPGDTA